MNSDSVPSDMYAYQNKNMRSLFLEKQGRRKYVIIVFEVTTKNQNSIRSFNCINWPWLLTLIDLEAWRVNEGF